MTPLPPSLSVFVLQSKIPRLVSIQRQKMQIFVKTLGGASLPLDVDPTASVAAVKAAVEAQEYLPAALMRLNHGGVQLNSGSLAAAGIEEADTLTLLFGVKGGMRAKWRKKRMRRLRRKRRKMRQRAR